MKRIPTVSVIIPAFNQERFIGRCIRSVLNQSMHHDDYEIIIVNDASTDRTQYALEIFQEEITVIHNSENLGLPGTLNVGIRHARGRFVVRVDADDYVHAEYLNLLSLFLAQNDYLDAVACDYVLVDDHEQVLARKNCLTDPIGCGIMFRIEQLIDVGLYDEKMLCHEEKDMLIRFRARYSIFRVEIPLYRYRRHDSNMTNNHHAMDEFMAELKAKHGDEKVRRALAPPEGIG